MVRIPLQVTRYLYIELTQVKKMIERLGVAAT